MTRPARAGDDAMAELMSGIGDDAARQLAREFGGTEVYIPRSIGEHHPLCVALGRDGADRLARWAGGGTLAVPKQAERRQRVLDLRRTRALTGAQIARETGFSQRHVFRLLREEREDRQPGLFDLL